MIYRKEYMDNCTQPDAHYNYYVQFATPGIIRLVEARIGRNKIISSNDKHFNDIPLILWDQMKDNILAIVGGHLRESNGTGGVSLSDCVCTAKAAAEKIRREAQTIEE